MPSTPVTSVRKVRRAALSLAALTALADWSFGCAPAPQRSATSPSTVTSEDLRNPSEPIEIVLQRKVPGLVVSRNSAGDLVLQIRGSSAYNGNDTPPLYVVNGTPVKAGLGGALPGIDPADIDSIKILKGAEAGIYGIDGANGVIVIKTKTSRAKRTP